MRKIKEVLRLHYEKGLSIRQIAKSLSIGRSTVQDYLDRSERARLSWPFAADLDEASLERQLYPPVFSVAQETRQMPSMEYLYQELKRKSKNGDSSHFKPPVTLTVPEPSKLFDGTEQLVDIITTPSYVR